LKDYARSLVYFIAAEQIAKLEDPAQLTPLFYFQLAAALERNKNYDERKSTSTSASRPRRISARRSITWATCSPTGA